MAIFGRESRQDEQRAQMYARWMQSQNPFAIASQVLGVFSLIEFGALIVFGIGGIACGVIALRQLGRGDARYVRGRALAWGGIVTSVISLILAAWLYLRR